MAKARVKGRRPRTSTKRAAKTPRRKATAKPSVFRSTIFAIVKRTAGALMLALALASWISLLTWSFSDPGATKAAGHTINNLLGVFGAAWSDLLIQLFGLSAVVLILPLAGWGWHLASRRYPPYPISRIVLLPLAALGATTAFALWPFKFHWPMPHGLGGIFGDYFVNEIGALAWTPIYKGAASLCLFLVAATSLLFASGIRILTLWRIWAVDLKFAGQVFYLIFEPLFRWVEDAASNFAFAFRRPMRKSFAWKKIINKMREDDDEDWPEFNPPSPSLQDIERPLPVHNTNPYADPYDERVEPYFASTPIHSGPHMLNDAAKTGPQSHPTLSIQTPQTIPIEAHGEDYVSPRPRRSQGPSNPASLTSFPKQRSQRDCHELPVVELLNKPHHNARTSNYAVNILQENARFLEDTLQDFGVKGEIVCAHPGPVVTLYELEPARGVKTSRVISLSDDIARSMGATSARVAVIPGRNAIGIELPNAEREMVFLRELFESENFVRSSAKLPLALGKDIAGDPVIADLTRMPHLLIAGTTGSGKSVGINTMIASLLYRLSPQECRLILVDPKMLELSVYEGIPHLLTPVVTDPKKAITALKWTIREMEERYKKMSILGVRNISSFNERIEASLQEGRTPARKVQTGFDPNTGRPIFETEELGYTKLPYIVVVIDEMADLMMVAGKDIEAAVQRLAQMARAAGIHLITATQRPSVDVITGTIKANFPTRVSFRVTTKVDSRTILGEQGAEQLLGDGDMLYMSGGGAITRVHGPFLSDDEIEAIVDHLKSQGTPEYLEEVTQDLDADSGADNSVNTRSSGDALYDEAVAVVLRDRRVSTSYIQRRLSIGYNKAASLIERMEAEGLISAANTAGKRDILVESDAA